MPRFCITTRTLATPFVSALRVARLVSTRVLGFGLLGLGLLALDGTMGGGTARADSRLDPRLRSALDQVDGLRQSGVRTALMPQALGSLYPGVDVGASGSELTFRCLIVLEAGQEEATLARLHALGVTTRTRAGDVVTATLPLAAVERMESEPGIVRVELTRRLEPSLDVSRNSVRGSNANGASQPPYPETGFTGKGVLVGVVDTGIDFTNQDFKNGDGTTRLEAYWDQTITQAPLPAGFGYGVEWTAAALNSGSGNGSIDNNGHGTHVAGILAGNGSATGGGQNAYQFVGMAPESPMVIVRTLFTTDSVIDAVDYIFGKADGRPVVVNLSLGTQGGPHDASDTFNKALDNLSGSGKILVAAAGNEGGLGLHGMLTLPPSGADSVVFTFQVPTYSANGGSGNDYFAIDGWYSRDDNISFLVESPNGRRTQLTASGASTQVCLPTSGGDGRVLVDNNTQPSATGDRNIYIEAIDLSQGASCGAPRAGLWKIVARRAGAITDGDIHFWLFADQLGSGASSPTFVTGKDESTLIASPASAAEIVAVGATITKVAWLATAGNIGYQSVTAADLGKTASFSSPGPLRDGTLQPDLVAPGMGIASTRSSNVPADANRNMRDGQHTINQGTSQAAPHVAGAIALVMQKFGAQTPEQILSRLQGSAQRDGITGSNPGNLYGYGRLDIVTALDFGTPIFLSRLEALPADAGGIRLAWTVEADEPFAGFHVSRADAADGVYERRTAALLTGSRDFEYLDLSVTPGRSYWYRLEAVTTRGGTESFGPLEARAGAPRLQLAQNGPNPFQASTTIRFGLPAAGPVSLRVFDVEGRLVRTLLDGPLPAGSGEAHWDGRDSAGVDQPTGVYFYRLNSAHGSETRKMILKR